MNTPFGLSFTPRQQVKTCFGLRFIETAVPTQEFWTAWRNSASSLREQGFSVHKGDLDGLWRVTRWTDPKTIASPPEVVGYTLQNTQCLYPYQISHAAALCAAVLKYGSALDASDTGTGKTFAAIAVTRELHLTPCIVCPKSVILSWRRVTEEHFQMRPRFVVNWEGAKTKHFAHGILNEDDVYTWKLSRDHLLIFDEAHKAKGEYTQNAKMVIAAKRQGIPLLLVSATIAAQPREMRAMGFALGLHTLVDFRQWSMELGCYQNKWNGWECVDAKSAMAKVHAALFPGKGNRIRIADLGDAFPETQIRAEVYQIKNSDAQNQEYQKLIAEIGRLKEKKKQNAQAAILTLNLRYRQLAELYKVDLLAELTEEYLENKMSVVIFVNFSATTEALQERFSAAAVIHGGQSELERQDMIDLFQRDTARVMIANVQAGGVGVSLHDVRGEHPRVSLICPTYSATQLKQALGRIHRAGGKSKSLQRLIYAAGTVEESVCKSVARKLEAVSSLNDGDLMEGDVLGLLQSEDEDVE